MDNLYISSKKGIDIQSGMIGLFFEDINYGADGGLYAEMIENRNFEFVEAKGHKGAYVQEFDGSYAWSVCQGCEESTRMAILSEQPLSAINLHYLRVTAKENNASFCNNAYEGIYLEKGKCYQVSFYARSGGYEGCVDVSIIKDHECFGHLRLSKLVTNEWQLFRGTLEATETIRYAKFVVTLSQTGTVDFDFISMMPEDAVLGIFRADLIKWLQEFKPGFIRFPGGCIVEGNEIANRYRWKDSIGLPVDRKVNWNRWAVHDNKEESAFTGPYSHYNQTLGMGYYEYFLLCEYLGARPIPVQNVALACQYQSNEKIPVDTEEFQEYIQDVLDLIEFANGDISTKWGSIRGKMGHEKPFGLEYIGIGNEQWETDEVDYFRRYEMFETAVHKYDPTMKLLSSAGPNVRTKTYESAWEWARRKQKGNPDFTAGIDEHYYVAPEWFYENNDFYDKYPREVKVFAGEYAAHIGNGMNREDVCTMEAALAEAAYMTGLERNADVVVLAAYAPLFARVGYAQWSPDLIWFNDKDSYGTPSYYVQAMFSNHMGGYTLESKVDNKSKGLYETVSFDEEKKDIIIKLVNANDYQMDVAITIEEYFHIKGAGTILVLRANDPTYTNSVEYPNRVIPIQKGIENGSNEFTVTLSSKAFYIIRICTGE